MFNFSNIQIVKRYNGDTDSFVGIRKNDNGDFEFKLPIGFDEFPEQDFYKLKNMFFRMYKTFKKFENNRNNKDIADKKPNNKDNLTKKSHGYSFKDKNDDSVVMYSKITMIEKIFELYQDLSLDVIEFYISKSDKIDFSKIHNYLDKAIYLDNDSFYIEEIDTQKNVINYGYSALIGIFCFILHELEQELEEKSDTRVIELATAFKNKYLVEGQSLFDEETFESTIFILKDILSHIDKTTPYKDEYFWRIFETVEYFLYGSLDNEEVDEEGTFWGIKNFSSIWEDMCQTFFFKNYLKEIVYADTEIQINNKNVSNLRLDKYNKIYAKDTKSDYPFYIEFRDEKRFVRPDLILESKINKIDNNLFDKENIEIIIKDTKISSFKDISLKLNNKDLDKEFKAFSHNLKLLIKKEKLNAREKMDNHFINYPIITFNKCKEDLLNKFNSNELTINNIIDFKYLDYIFFTQASNKLRKDICKQLLYEKCLHINYTDKNQNFENNLWIPKYQINHASKLEPWHKVDTKKLIKDITDNNINIFHIDFLTIQSNYLEG